LQLLVCWFVLLSATEKLETGKEVLTPRFWLAMKMFDSDGLEVNRKKAFQMDKKPTFSTSQTDLIESVNWANSREKSGYKIQIKSITHLPDFPEKSDSRCNERVS